LSRLPEGKSARLNKIIDKISQINESCEG